LEREAAMKMPKNLLTVLQVLAAIVAAVAVCFIVSAVVHAGIFNAFCEFTGKHPFLHVLFLLFFALVTAISWLAANQIKNPAIKFSVNILFFIIFVPPAFLLLLSLAAPVNPHSIMP
jgi:hypothetical protein